MVGMPLIRLVQSRFRTTVVWAMMPLAFLTGQPVSGCICADGHYEPLCRAELCPGKTGAERQTTADACCGCSCCAKHSGQRNSDCCKRATGCYGRSANPHQGGTEGMGVTDNSCCTPVVRAQAIPTIVNLTRVVDDHHVPALCSVTLELPCPIHGSSAARRLERDTGSPPSDLVIILRRLVI